MNDIKEGLNIVLRQTIPGDLESLFIHQLDEGAAWMAAFVNEHWKDKEAYLAKWNRLLKDDTLNIRTIVVDDKVAGSISTWHLGGDLQISYGLGKEYWNRGIATHALQQFLAIMQERPLFGRAAFDNIGSAKVLTKCGFRKIGEDRFYSHARKEEIAEIVYLLEA